MTQRGRPKGSKNKPKTPQTSSDTSVKSESISVSKSSSDFEVEYLNSETPSGETILTSVGDMTDKKIEQLMRVAVSQYDPQNQQYSAFLNPSATASGITVDRVNELSVAPQQDLTKTLEIVGIVQQYINKNYLIGNAYDSISKNINTQHKLINPGYSENRNKAKQVKRATTILDDFNNQINLEGLIRHCITTTYAEGTYISYLRQKDSNWTVDYFPLGIAEISDYSVNSNPVVLIVIEKLTDALESTMLLNRKRQPLFFKNIEEVIRENYPHEVYQAYKSKDTYAKLDVTRTGVIKINDMGRKYGLSPIWRSIPSALMLESLDNSDRATAKARSKKIIYQKLSEKLLGDYGEKRGYSEMAFAHNQLMQAWRQSIVVTTPPAYVEKIEYVEPKVEMTASEKTQEYNTRIMNALGISYMDTDGGGSVSTARISLNQLLKTIDEIANRASKLIKHFYEVVLTDAGIDLIFTPDIQILNSELLEYDLRKSLAQFAYGTLNASYETSYGLVGIDVDDEKAKREAENEAGYDEIFAPRLTNNTMSGGTGNGGSSGSSGDGSGDSTGGRTLIDDPISGEDKQLEDQARYASGDK